MRPPTLVFLIGPPAVGKMTVGQALERLTGFRLFHHHQIIDLVSGYFPYSEEPASAFERLVVAYRRLFFEEAARGGLPLISTTGLRSDLPGDEAAVRRYVQPFLDCGGRVVFIELVASLETRLARNLTANRRQHKKTDWSTEENLRNDAALHCYDSGGVLPFDLPLLRLETEGTTAEGLAATICAHFALPLIGLSPRAGRPAPLA